MTIDQIRYPNKTDNVEEINKKHPQIKKRPHDPEETRSGNQNGQEKKSKTQDETQGSDFFGESHSLFPNEECGNVLTNRLDLQENRVTPILEDPSNSIFDKLFFDKEIFLFSLPPIPFISKIDPSALLSLPPLEAILQLEELEKSIPSNHPTHKNNEPYFCTAKTATIPDPKDPSESITILTGELKFRSIPPNASETLRGNLIVAKGINDYVQNSIPFSPNFLQRSRIFSKDNYDVRYVNVVRKVSELVRSKFEHRNSLQRVKRILKYKTGRCYELSLVGLFKVKIFCVPQSLMEIMIF